MFGYREATNNRPGSRRLGGPILFEDLWPALRDDLCQMYMTNGGPARRVAATPEAAEAGGEPSPSFSRAA
jgi:hypothetical protein